MAADHPPNGRERVPDGWPLRGAPGPQQHPRRPVARSADGRNRERLQTGERYENRSGGHEPRPPSLMSNGSYPSVVAYDKQLRLHTTGLAQRIEALEAQMHESEDTESTPGSAGYRAIVADTENGRLGRPDHEIANLRTQAATLQARIALVGQRLEGLPEARRTGHRRPIWEFLQMWSRRGRR